MSGIGQLWHVFDGVGRGPGVGRPKHEYQHGLGLLGRPFKTYTLIRVKLV